MRTRNWAMTAGLTVLVVAAGAVAAVDQHVYRVSLFDPWSLPERVHACGRSFLLPEGSHVVDRAAAEAHRPELGPWEKVGESRPPLHAPMEILSHPRQPVCGMSVLVGPDDDHLTEYTLQGGP